MSELARFCGIVIVVYKRGEHPAPHVHVRHGKGRGATVGAVEIRTGRYQDGNISPRDLRLVQAWLREHREAALQAWDDFQEGQRPKKIGPFESKPKAKKATRDPRAARSAQRGLFLPLIVMVERLPMAAVRVFFSDGVVREVRLPEVLSSRRARIVDEGMGLDPGNGMEVSAGYLRYRLRGRTFLP